MLGNQERIDDRKEPVGERSQELKQAGNEFIKRAEVCGPLLWGDKKTGQLFSSVCAQHCYVSSVCASLGQEL